MDRGLPNKSIVTLGFILLTFFFQTTQATLRFANRNSAFLIGSAQSKLRLGNVHSILGWGQESIVKDYGPTTPEQWIENYSNGVIISPTDTHPSTHLVYATSNATNYAERAIKANSNSLLFLTKNNSNALLTISTTNYLVRLTLDNSNAIIGLNQKQQTSSNSITMLDAKVRTQSNALVFGDRVNSNSLLSGSGGFPASHSNALVFLDQKIRHQSNTLLFFERTNSNAKLFLARNNSNALVFGLRVTSSAILSKISIGVIHYEMTEDWFLSNDNTLIITNNTVIDGNGHTIHLAFGTNNIIDIADNRHVTFENVLFDNFNEAAFQFGDNASILFANGAHLDIHTNLDLTRTWTFAGNTTFHGLGTHTYINPGVNLVVLPGSVMTITNLGLEDLAGNCLRCADTSTIIFDNCTLGLSDNFSFTSGSLEFVQDVKITGNRIFSYESESVSVVGPFSCLMLDGCTFRYAPPTDNRDLLMLFNNTSELYLFGATLESTTTGMRLTSGRLILEHKNFLLNTGAMSYSQGFCLGNLDPACDLDIQILPGASLDLVTGMLDYQNTDAL